MAAFKIKRGRKVYQAKEFSSLVQLARRGLIGPQDPVFVPKLDQWVYAGSIRELQSIFSTEASPEEGSLTAQSLPSKPQPAAKFRIHSTADESDGADELELPMVYVEALNEGELPPVVTGQPGPKWVQHMDADLIATQKATPEMFAGLREASPSPSENNLSTPPQLEGLKDLFQAAPPISGSGTGTVDLRGQAQSALRLGALEERPQADPLKALNKVRPVTGVTVSEKTRGVSLLRVLLVLALPAATLGLYFWTVTSTANTQFEPVDPGTAPAAVSAVAVDVTVAEVEVVEVEATPDPQDVLAAQEKAIRGKVPLKLRNPVRTPVQVEDDIIAEMLNAGAIPLSVELEPLVGEFPPRSSLRSLEVNVNLRIRETSLVTDEEQVALAALIIGKYARSGGLRVTGLDVTVLADGQEPVNTYTFTGEQVRDFYGRSADLSTFLGWI